MKTSALKLKKLPVETNAGDYLGKVGDFIIDIETQSILEYIIKPSNPIRELIEGDLIIHRGQVLDIKQNKIVVEDNVAEKHKQRELKENKQTAEKKTPALS